MSQIRTERFTIIFEAEPSVIGQCPIRARRRRRGLSRPPVARAGGAAHRMKNARVTQSPRAPEPHVVGVHDFGDGRQAIEFEGPSLDMMLYHDRGVTIAEWITVDGELVTLIPVGSC